MPVDIASIEIDRIDNLIRNFGWSISKKEILAKKITLIIEKPVVLPELSGAPSAD